ncbi:hypothetical protein [Brachybacterium hainanense]|uniref:Uncharacterized protein n=1 Tax=Brachybacterium hainanense TaxID=1541174 RepID=A0ABV6RAE0_9MICO
MSAFEAAARAEAERYAHTPRMNVGTVTDRLAEAYMAGAAATRDHLAAQEPSEEEVEVAARALWERISPALAWDDATEAYRDACRMDARAALRAAAAVRRQG